MHLPTPRVLLSLTLAAAVGCSSSSDSTAPASSANRTWRGIIGATGAQGTFDLTSAGSSDPRTLTGTLKFGGTTVALTGTFGVAAGTVAVTGGAYTLAGTVSGARIYGTYLGAGGGSFAGAEAATAADAKLYCGTYTETVGGSATRYWSFAVTGTTLTGSAATSTTPIRLQGTLSGSASVGGVTGQGASITSPDATTSGSLATGAVSATAAAGVFNNGGGTSGTWQGSICP
ncbi:MAG: hypothetical protein HY275_10730 [Gemmatimonadetes bacterium]|nr:hypothetical protein [Gemmatimonadota bacterium]